MAIVLGHVGEFANVVQLAGLNAVSLIVLIVEAANRARLHKRNCIQFANHLKLIGNLLEQIKVSELRNNPATREPFDQLEDALRRAYVLVDSCRERSYLYLFAMGWNIVNQFKRSQQEIDFCLGIMPLVNLVHNNHVKERLEYIQKDTHEYKLDKEVERVHIAVLKQEPTRADTIVLKKSISRSYPHLPLDKALQRESEKLQEELQQSQSDYEQCRVIQHLIQVTQTAARDDAPISSGDELKYYDVSDEKEQWHYDLLGCCAEPTLCISTFCFPCGTFSKITSVATNDHMSPAQAFNDIIAYSLILSCCCYTCCIRRKLRKMLNIKGGSCDDFLSHLICCCCSLVQEWREVQFRGIKGPVNNKTTTTTPPPTQYMEA